METRKDHTAAMEIIAARAAVRGLIALDVTGEVTELQIVVAFLSQAEKKLADYLKRRDRIDTVPGE